MNSANAFLRIASPLFMSKLTSSKTRPLRVPCAQSRTLLNSEPFSKGPTASFNPSSTDRQLSQSAMNT